MQKIPPSTGGKCPGFKKCKLFLQITMGGIKKTPQAKIPVIGTIFTPKIAQKMQKNDQQESSHSLWAI